MVAKLAFSMVAELTLQKITNFTLKRAILRKTNLLKYKFHSGQPIAKRLIPSYYSNKYGITNLFRLELPGHWRLVYSLVNRSGTVVFVLEIVNHKMYNKRFGYK